MEDKIEKVDPFTFVNNITTRNTPNLIDQDPDLEKEYNPFLTNRAFSNFPDTLFMANEMNMRTHITKRMQYDFYKYVVRPGKRYAKWPKKDKEKLALIELVSEYYDCGKKTAQEYLAILTKSDLEIIKKEMDKGGVDNARSRKSSRSNS
jgi:molecular chaperone DnaK (HSP70)